MPWINKKWGNKLQDLKAVIRKPEQVDNVESTNWLIDFWSRKDVAGIILMPCFRHQFMQINESLEAKASKNGCKPLFGGI